MAFLDQMCVAGPTKVVDAVGYHPYTFPALPGPSASTDAPTAWDKATQGMVKRADLEIVDCLLPGQVRQLGNSSFLSQRRPMRTTASECSIRGGEYVAYDRADNGSRAAFARFRL